MTLNSVLYISDIKKNNQLDYINQVWHAIMSLDIIELYSILDDRISYNNLNKEQFVKLLDNKLKKHKQLGDKEFYLDLVECQKCHEGEIICQFVGLDSGIAFGLFFNIIDYFVKH